MLDKFIYSQISSNVVRYCQILVLRVFQGCFKGVPLVFQGCSKGVSGEKFITSFKGVARLIQEDSSGIPWMIVSCSKCASWVCKGCVRGV